MNVGKAMSTRISLVEALSVTALTTVDEGILKTLLVVVMDNLAPWTGSPQLTTHRVALVLEAMSPAANTIAAAAMKKTVTRSFILIGRQMEKDAPVLANYDSATAGYFLQTANSPVRRPEGAAR